MAEYNSRTASIGIAGDRAIDEGLRTHMGRVYGIMSIGMLMTFAVAWAVGTSPDLLSLLRNPITLKPNMLGWVVMFAPLGMVFVFSAMINRMSAAAAQTLFYGFAAVMGLSISWIFVAFTGFAIAQIFLITSIAFASLSLWGYVTKKDLSAMGTFLIMGVVGLLIASVVNIFLGSGVVHLAISVLGVLIFAGLTAYDTQNIKNTYLQMAHHSNTEWLAKAGIMGALSLYLNFINMFMFLLSLFGNRE